MRIKEKYTMRSLGTSHIVVMDTPDGAVNMSKVLSFNKTAAFIWQEAKKGDFTAQSIAGALCETYDVTPEQALHDAEEIIRTWAENGLIEQ